MKIIIFSKLNHVLERLQEQLDSVDLIENITVCHTFHEIGEAVVNSHDLIVFHLSPGDEEEKTFYEFVDLYQQTKKIFVVSNSPEQAQGKRLLSAGVCAYTNTFTSSEKFSVAFNVVCQGKVWMGAEIAKAFNQLGVNVKSESYSDRMKKTRESKVEQELESEPVEAIDSNLVSSVMSSIKKLFGKS